ncbi:MAG: hypothetical protein LC792_22555, partial [Actinobacteria bacterium]|nr:hypothetical protein [Actinomycetota bacterium]
GDNGAATLTFTVALTPPTITAVTVAYGSSDKTATAGQDYDAANGSLTFNPGDTSQPITVPVTGDTGDKVGETFVETLSAPSAGARIGKGVATGTIVDDDAPPEIFSPDISVEETTKDDSAAVFPVRLAGPRSFSVTVRYETQPKSATPPADFTPVSGELTFAPGDEVKPVSVPIRGDSHFEAAETVALRLSDPRNGAVADPEAVATIIDDDQPGYLLAGTDGGVYTFGGAGFFGSAGPLRLNQAIVTAAPHPSGRGYWLVGVDGGIFSFGEARFHGSTGALRLKKPIVGMAPTPSGEGYWLVGTDGGIFSFGDARYFGSTGAVKLNKPIVGMAATPTGAGYWLVATDGGIFSFGDARFFGSTGAQRLNEPIVGMAAAPSGHGYWLLATDGGIFSFGDARFLGSTGAVKLNKPIVGMAATPTGAGYWLVATDGGTFAFGDATFLGSTGALKPNKPVVGLTTL